MSKANETPAARAVRQAQAQNEARNVLANLGVAVAHLPPVCSAVSILDAENAIPVRPKIVFDVEKRFRRTNREMAELKRLTEWQLKRRMGADTVLIFE